MQAVSKIQAHEESPWVVETLKIAKERADVSEGLAEVEVWLSSGKKVHDVETIEQKGVTVIIGTITGTIYVREQDVVAIATP